MYTVLADDGVDDGGAGVRLIDVSVSQYPDQGGPGAVGGGSGPAVNGSQAGVVEGTFGPEAG